MPDDVQNEINIEIEKLEIEREKLELEREKLKVEKSKARWAAFAIMIPILAIAGTVALGMWTQYKKGRDDFALKSAEIIFATDIPQVTRSKAKALSNLFPGHLPSSFAENFDPKTQGSDSKARMDLLQMLAAKPDAAGQILAFWKAVYPGTDWIKEIEAAWIQEVKSKKAHGG